MALLLEAGQQRCAEEAGRTGDENIRHLQDPTNAAGPPIAHVRSLAMELLRRQHAEARDRLPEPAYDYFAGGAGDEVSLAENEQAWQHVWLRPRQLLGLGAADASLELLGVPMAAPIVLAPAAAQGLLHPDRELAVARAAAAVGLTLCLSTRATTDPMLSGSVRELEQVTEKFLDGFGEVRVTRQGHMVKLNARSSVPLPTGTQVTVADVLSATAVVVVPTYR